MDKQTRIILELLNFYKKREKDNIRKRKGKREKEKSKKRERDKSFLI